MTSSLKMLMNRANSGPLTVPVCSLAAPTSINSGTPLSLLPGGIAASRQLAARSRSVPAPGTRAGRQQPTTQAGRVGVSTREAWWQKETPPNMKSVNSVEELLHEMAVSRDRLVILDFYAQWCGSCKALYPKLAKLSEEHPEILVLKVNFDDNKTMCKALDVKVLPFFQFYRGSEGRVDEFPASVSRVQRIRDAIAEHSTARCSVGNESPGLEALHSLIATQHQAEEEMRHSPAVYSSVVPLSSAVEPAQTQAAQPEPAAV